MLLCELVGVFFEAKNSNRDQKDGYDRANKAQTERRTAGYDRANKGQMEMRTGRCDRAIRVGSKFAVVVLGG